MGTQTIIESARQLKLPLSIVEEVLEDFIALQEKAPVPSLSILLKATEDMQMRKTILKELEKTILLSSLILSLEKSVDFKTLYEEVFRFSEDPAMGSMCKEVLVRSLQLNKDTLELTGLSWDVVKKRQKICLGE